MKKPYDWDVHKSLDEQPSRFFRLLPWLLILIAVVAFTVGALVGGQ